MRRVGISAEVFVLLFLALMSPIVRPANAADQPPPPKLKVGDVAPDFKLQYFTGEDLKDVSLSEYRGKKNVVLAFYIFAFTGG
jgi:AhpC/TSA family